MGASEGEIERKAKEAKDAAKKRLVARQIRDQTMVTQAQERHTQEVKDLEERERDKASESGRGEDRQHEDGNGEAANHELVPAIHSVNDGGFEGGRRRRGHWSGFPGDIGSGNTGSGESCEFRVGLAAAIYIPSALFSPL